MRITLPIIYMTHSISIDISYLRSMVPVPTYLLIHNQDSRPAHLRIQAAAHITIQGSSSLFFFLFFFFSLSPFYFPTRVRSPTPLMHACTEPNGSLTYYLPNVPAYRAYLPPPPQCAMQQRAATTVVKVE